MPGAPGRRRIPFPDGNPGFGCRRRRGSGLHFAQLWQLWPWPGQCTCRGRGEHQCSDVIQVRASIGDSMITRWWWLNNLCNWLISISSLRPGSLSLQLLGQPALWAYCLSSLKRWGKSWTRSEPKWTGVLKPWAVTSPKYLHQTHKTSGERFSLSALF